jgi:hypothetical protein
MLAMNETPEHRAIEELLPWHAAGTLSRSDAQRVEQALTRDANLARSYAKMREELAETTHLNEALGAPSARAMEKLFAKIDAEPPRRGRGSGMFAKAYPGFVSSLSPRALAWASAAAVPAILLQGVFMTNMALKRGRSGGYETAATLRLAADTGTFTFIRFAPQASVGDINKFLQANNLSTATGPIPGELYKVRVIDGALPESEVGALLKRLGSHKVVGFIMAAQ